MARQLAQLADLPVGELRGVGPKAVDALAAVDVRTVADLLTYYPRRYLDRTKEARLAELAPGEEATVLVEVAAVQSRTTRNRRRMVLADVTDGTGRLRVTFFNQPWRERQLRPGLPVVLFGRVEVFQGRRQMTNPVVDLVGDRTARVIPVYPQSEKAGVASWDVATWIEEVLERAGRFADPVPAGVLARWGLVDRTTAFTGIHRPESMQAMVEARRRLVFDELLRVQLKLVQAKRELEATTEGIRHDVGGALVARFHERLPYELTGAQRRAIAEIDADLAGPHPMHRLLQGDVGSGKTVVAVSALLAAVQGGHQGALMAPTAVLAEQHHAGTTALLEGFSVADDSEGTLFAAAAGGVDRPLRVELLTNRTTAAERRRLLADLAGGGVDLLVGTHALIQEDIRFRSLGVVVIDEQHRFGVEQRAALRQRGEGEAVPDVLVMTATPIPRTAAMTVYGDLDVSVLDELPPGRTPVATVWARHDGDEAGVWEHVRTEVAAGRQAYVVCPLIDESEKLEVASAQETFERLGAGELAGLRVGLLHGRLGVRDKEEVMARFRRGDLDVLVATTVIEVGVDVPNATAMVILDADRFGIAQLHQLRGRVGRGAERSHCYLVGEATTPEGEARLEAMVRTTDGFELAEVDLDLRGEGTIMGERQKGRNDLKLASLRRDRPWVERARQVAFELVGDDPTLAGHPGLADEVATLLGDEERTEFLLKS
jgi:ATP-dependent DNA helicase RecG